MRYLRIGIIIAFFSSITFSWANCQDSIRIIDQVIAVVGNKIIKQSDIENQFLELKARGANIDENEKCNLLEEMLKTKLMVNQAAIDSVEVTDSEVESELNQRLNMYINQAGDAKTLEDYFKKSILQMKEDFRNDIRDNLISRKMEGQIVGDAISITPTEVKNFYNSIPKDSIPLVNSQVEIYQIGMYPPYSEKDIFDLKEKMLDLRKRITNGESFATLAVLYSEDPGSAQRGGEIGYLSKGELDPEYAKAAFALKEKGEVSRIVESQFGYHIIQLVDKKGDKVNTRHILMKPKADPEAIIKVTARLDSVLDLVRKDSITFQKAALYYSEDKSTRFNGGLVMNKQTQEPKFEMDQMDPMDYRILKDLKIGEISEPYESRDDKNKKMYKVAMIKSRTNPHKANMKEDFDLLKNYALNNKRNNIISEWMKEKQKSTYIHIDDSYKSCPSIQNGWLK